MVTHRIIRTRYRLNAADLADGSLRTTITNVSLEGLETLHPVLHLAGVEKRLVLDDQQCDDLAHITETAIMEEWIGREVGLVVDMETSPASITICAPDDARLRQRRPIRPSVQTSLLTPYLVALLIITIFIVVFLLDSNETIWQWFGG